MPSITSTEAHHATHTHYPAPPAPKHTTPPTHRFTAHSVARPGPCARSLQDLREEATRFTSLVAESARAQAHDSTQDQQTMHASSTTRGGRGSIEPEHRSDLEADKRSAKRDAVLYRGKRSGTC